MGTCEGRDGSCDWFSRVAHRPILRTGCILPRELRWLKEWFKAQWPGVIMSEALWEGLGCEKCCIKTGYYCQKNSCTCAQPCSTQHYALMLSWDNTDLGLNKGKFTKARFEPTTSGLTCLCSTSWDILAVSILSISLFEVYTRRITSYKPQGKLSG